MNVAKRVTPVLVYEDIEASHHFLVSAFGFSPGEIAVDDRGRAVHGEVRVGGEAIWLHRVAREHGLDAAHTHDTASGGLAVIVDDVDAHYRHAVAAGARTHSPPVVQPYGRREYGATDPEGHRWWFGTPQG